jgi:hypothetical protein
VVAGFRGDGAGGAWGAWRPRRFRPIAWGAGAELGTHEHQTFDFSGQVAELIFATARGRSDLCACGSLRALWRAFSLVDDFKRVRDLETRSRRN